MSQQRGSLSSYWHRFIQATQKFFQILLKILEVMFGHFQWQRPLWLDRLGEKLSPKFREWKGQIQELYKNNRSSAHRLGIGMLVALLLGAGGFWWWKNQPKPEEVSVTVKAPAWQALEEKTKPSELFVQFSKSVAPLDQIGKSVSQGIELRPSMEGSWKWASDKELVFTPTKEWPLAKKFKISLSKKAFPAHVRLSNDEPEFETDSFRILSKSADFYQHPENPKDKRVTATIKVSYPVDPQSLADKVRISITGDTEILGNIPKEYKANITYDKYYGTIMVTSDPIPLPRKDTTAKIRFEKGWNSSWGGNKINEDLEFSVGIPGTYTFLKIANVDFNFAENKQYELEQVLAIETSTEVLEKEFDQAVEAYLLPKDKAPSLPGAAIQENYPWSVGEVDTALLAKSQKLQLQRVPSERPQTAIHTFKMKVPEKRQVFVRVKKGMKSFHEYILAEDYQTVVSSKEFPQEIRILHEGSILTLGGDKKLSILTRGLKTVKIEVGHVLPDQLNHLLSQSGGNFSNPEFYSSYQFNWENISEKFTEYLDVAESKTGKPEFASFEAGKFLNKSQGPGRGLLFVSLQGYEREKKRTFLRAETRFLLVTDLGVVEKSLADKSHDVFVQSVSNGMPVAGATVEVIGKNGLPAVTAHTDAQGRAHFPDLSDFKQEKTPLSFVVRKGNDLSFLPFNRYDRRLQYSRFDIGGIHTQGDENRLQAYIFTDRGLYRPGETYHLSAIVRSFDWKTQLEGAPLEWVVTDPKGQEIYKEKVTLGKDGFIELSNSTQETAFVGTYTGALYIIKDEQRNSMIGSSTFRVEEFVPDRLKITSGFSVPETSGWTSPEGLKAWVRVMNLFGFPAEKVKINASFSLAPALPTFPAFKDYHFYFSKTEKSFEETLSSSETNDKGEAEYDIDLSRFEKGNYRLRVVTEAFEPGGGRSVVSQSSIMVSPSKYFIGYKTESDLKYLKLNSAHRIEFLAVDPNLKKTTVDGLTLSVIEKQWVSVLTKQPNGTFKYESVQKDREVKKEPFVINPRGAFYSLPTSAPGDYKLTLTNKEGVEVSYLEFTVIGQGNILGKIERNAELQIKLSKADYTPGEDIEMQIRAPYTGSGLITIERDKVYAVKWFKTNSLNSMQTIRVPAGLEGNAYVNVTFLRDMNSREIFMSPLSYGVVPFSVDLKRRQLKLDLKASAEQKPGTPLKIEYSSGKPGRLIVFAVDEGILQVAKYQTPDPLKVFFQKRALEIETSQLLDLVLPEYKIVKELSASGGDGDGGALARNLNPFRRKGKPPVAFWSGIMNTDGTAKSVTYNIPDYFNGTLRIIAVAVTPDSIGVMRTDTLVRGDFILTPTVPFVLTPGDEAVVGVSVFNNLKGSGAQAKIHFTAQATDQIEILEGAQADLVIPETKEVRTTLKIRAKDKLGVAQLHFQAGIATQVSKLSEDISLRPATPYRTQIWGGTLKDSSEKVKITRSVYPEFAKRSVAVSYLPLSLAHGLLEYLTAFPYGCTEQLISMAYPTLVLGDKPDFNFKPDQREKAFKNALALLRQRQTSDGGFGLYGSYGGSAGFPSLYAVQYLIEAKDRGFAVPVDLLDRARGFLHSFSNSTSTSIQQARTTAYALYLLARMGQSVGNEMNTLLKEIDGSGFKKEWGADIGSLFMASTYKLLQQDAMAEKMSRDTKPMAKFASDYQWYHDSYIHNAFMVYLMAKHFPEKLKSVSDSAVASFVTMIQQGSYNTLNSALAIMALESLSQASNQPVEVTTTVSELDSAGKSTPLALPKSLFPQAKYSAAASALEIRSKGAQTVFYQVQQSGFDHLEKLQEIKNKIEIQREYRKIGGKESVNKLKMGEELEVHLKVRSIGPQLIPNVAIVDLIPSGFEVVLERSAHGAHLDLRKLLSPLQESTQQAFYLRKPLHPGAFLSLFLSKAYAQDEDGEGNYSETEVGDEGGGEGAGDGEGDPMGAEPPMEAAAEIPTLALPGSTMQVQFEEPREDRVVLYATVTTDATEYIYKIKATNQGTFTVPPAYAEDLYDRTVQALGPSSRIQVEGQ